MILINLKLKNFKKYIDKEFSFSEGLIGVLGANGAGKSTIFDAIIYALYGESKGAKELIKNSLAEPKDKVSVELSFEIGSDEYRVVRELRGKTQTSTALLYKSDTDVCSGAKETTAYIQSLTKMTKSAFMHTLFASQKELTNLSSMKNEDRKKMIRKLLGLDKIDSVEKNLKDKIRDIKKEIQTAQKYLLSEDEIESINNNIKEYQQNLSQKQDEIQKEQNSLKEIEKDIQIAQQEESRLSKLKDEKTSIQNSINILNTKIDSNNKNIENLTKEIAEIEQISKEIDPTINTRYTKLIEELNNQNSIKNSYIQKNEILKAQESLRVDYTKIKKDIKSLEISLESEEMILNQQKLFGDNLENRDKEINALDTKKENYSKILAQLEAEMQKANSQVEKLTSLGKSSNCPTCTRPLLEEYDNVLNSLKNSIIAKNKKLIDENNNVIAKIIESKNRLLESRQTLLNEYQNISNQLAIKNREKKMLKEAKNELERVEKRGKANNEELEKLKDITYDETIHNSLIEEEKTLKPLYEQNIAKEAKISKKETLISSQKSLIEQKTQDENELKSLKEKNDSIEYDDTKYKIAKDNLKNLQTQKETIQKELHKKEMEQKDIQNSIQNSTTKLSDDNKKRSSINEIELAKSDYEKIKVNLDIFKNSINSKIVPQISQYASTLYYTITNGKYERVEIDEEFDFYIYDDGMRHSIERFSGGEIDLANIVLRIAISKTLASLNGSNGVEFLAFDEVFGSQDEMRRVALLEAFNTIKEQYRQIFLISHEVEIKEMFERVIEV
jgi:exonuclease SbcC